MFCDSRCWDPAERETGKLARVSLSLFFFLIAIFLMVPPPSLALRAHPGSPLDVVTEGRKVPRPPSSTSLKQASRHPGTQGRTRGARRIPYQKSEMICFVCYCTSFFYFLFFTRNLLPTHLAKNSGWSQKLPQTTENRGMYRNRCTTLALPRICIYLPLVLAIFAYHHDIHGKVQYLFILW